MSQIQSIVVSIRSTIGGRARKAAYLMLWSICVTACPNLPTAQLWCLLYMSKLQTKFAFKAHINIIFTCPN